MRLGGITGDENEGFELQTSYTAPLRPVLPRFPLLPVAMNLGRDSVQVGKWARSESSEGGMGIDF